MPDTPYFTVAEARKLAPLGNTSTYPDADIDAMRVAVEEALEHACGLAFVPRSNVEQFDGNGCSEIVTQDWARPTAVTAATVNAVALDVTTLVVYRDGRIYNPANWTLGRGNVSVTYTHGYVAVPGRVKRAAILLTKRFLVDTPISDRATSLVNPDGTVQSFVTAGVRSAIFDIPEANAIVADYGVRAGAS